MDLRLNATQRSINFLVYLVFDLEAGRFILGENLLGASNFCAKICLEPSMHFPSWVAHSHFDLCLFFQLC